MVFQIELYNVASLYLYKFIYSEDMYSVYNCHHVAIHA
jgi:hypothetical protein